MAQASISTQTRNAQTIAVEMIRDAILEGRLLPGERLKEPQLAKELGISRTPIREALLTLQAEGLLLLEPNRGARVRSYQLDEIREMYDVRALLEGFAARRAALARSELAILELRASCNRFEELEDEVDVDVLALYSENLEFHGLVVEAAGNQALRGMVRSARLPMVYSSYCWRSVERSAARVYHKKITAAIEAGDADRAEWLMKEHLLQARDFLIDTLKERGEDAALKAGERLRMLANEESADPDDRDADGKRPDSD